MRQARILAIAGAVCAALGFSAIGNASATTLFGASAAPDSMQTATTAVPHVIRVQKTSDNRTVREKRRRATQDPSLYSGKNYTNKPSKNKVYKKRKRRTKKRYYNPDVWVGGDYYYDPYYDDPYYDPYYYDEPSYSPSYGRLSCGEIIHILRRKGYRRIQAHDCTGKVYTFVAYAGHKRYKLRVYSRNGSFKSRTRL